MADSGQYKVKTTITGTQSADDTSSVLKKDQGGCGCGNCAGANSGGAGQRSAG